MRVEFRCHACATHDVLRFTSLGDLAQRLAGVQSCLDGAGVAVGGFKCSNPLHPYARLILRTGATGHKGFSAKSEIRRGFNADFNYQHQVTARLWDREVVFTTPHKHCTMSPLEPQPKTGRASLDASL